MLGACRARACLYPSCRYVTDTVKKSENSQLIPALCRSAMNVNMLSVRGSMIRRKGHRMFFSSAVVDVVDVVDVDICCSCVVVVWMLMYLLTMHMVVAEVCFCYKLWACHGLS